MLISFIYNNFNSNMESQFWDPFLLTWINFNPTMDK